MKCYDNPAGITWAGLASSLNPVPSGKEGLIEASVYSFIKRSSYIYYTEDALRAAKDDIILVANKEGLTAHANAIAVRFED